MILGIDPGVTGAIAAVSQSGLVEVWDSPFFQMKVGKSNKKVPDQFGMARLVTQAMEMEEVDFVYIEKVHAMPKQGVTSSFNFGKGYGMWLGIIAALDLATVDVTPQRWMKEMITGTQKGKDAARARAAQLYPTMRDKLTRKKDDGRADALLIASFGSREQLGM